MVTPKSSGRRPPSYTKMGQGLSSGIEYAMTVALPTVGGYFLDRALGTKPWFVVVGATVGFILGFLRIMYADKYEKARRRGLGIDASSEIEREVPDVLKNKTSRPPGTIKNEVTGLTSYSDYRPRRFGDPVPDHLLQSTIRHPEGAQRP